MECCSQRKYLSASIGSWKKGWKEIWITILYFIKWWKLKQKQCFQFFFDILGRRSLQQKDLNQCAREKKDISSPPLSWCRNKNNGQIHYSIIFVSITLIVGSLYLFQVQKTPLPIWACLSDIAWKWY